MRDACGEMRLVDECSNERWVLCEVRMQTLDGDRAREARLTVNAAKMDRRHPARADLFAKLVASEDARPTGKRSDDPVIRGLVHPDNALIRVGCATTIRLNVEARAVRSELDRRA